MLVSLFVAVFSCVFSFGGICKENNNDNNSDACRVAAGLQGVPWLVLSVGQVFSITVPFAVSDFYVTPCVKIPQSFWMFCSFKRCLREIREKARRHWRDQYVW